MPIEDVQYLLKNSKPDTSLLFVDSSRRDYSAYPTPSEFVIDLQEPIRNVFGVEILDSAIANSMYNVDAQNCKLRFMLVDESNSVALPASELASGSVTVSDDLETRDSKALNLMAFNLGFASPLRSWLSDPLSSMYAVAVIDSSVLSPFFITSLPTSSGLGCRYFIVVQNKYSSVYMKSVVSGYAPIVQTSQTSQTFNGNRWTLFNDMYYSVEDDSVTGHAAAALLSSGGVAHFSIVPSASDDSTVTTAAMGYVKAGYYDVYSYETVEVNQQVFTNNTGLTNMTPDGSTPTVMVALDTANGYNQTVVPIQIAFGIGTATVETGNYVTNGALQRSLTAAFDDVGAQVTMTATSSSGIDKQSILKFQCPTKTVEAVNLPTYRLLLSSSQSTINSVIGLDTHPLLSMNALPRKQRGYGAVLVGGDTMCMYASVLGDTSQSLVSPGIINLTGIRYVTLRCKEIEEHIETQGKYGPFSTGIGVFKLQSSNNVVQVRSDYVNIVRKAFHPIGKLVRMTFRFEIYDGTLYDFKGVNNQLLLSIKYYAPIAPSDNEFRSWLNPDYDSDFQKFLNKKSGYAPRLDDQGYDPYDEDDVEEEESDESSSGEEIDEPTMRRFEIETQRRIIELERDARSAL